MWAAAAAAASAATMAAAAAAAATLAALVRAFTKRGLCVIPDALSPAELAAAQTAFDRDRRECPAAWELRGRSHDGGEVGESGRWQTEPLNRSAEFDGLITHPSTFGLLRQIMGPTLRLIVLDAMSRDPVDATNREHFRSSLAGSSEIGRGGVHWQMWHRESAAEPRPRPRL